MATKRDDVRTLLDRYSTTYAEEEGIRLADKPSPLYRLLVVALLLSARIAPPSVTMRPTSSAATGLIAFRVHDMPGEARDRRRRLRRGRRRHHRNDQRASSQIVHALQPGLGSAVATRVPMLRPAGSHTTS
jgi:hypothetical protein